MTEDCFCLTFFRFRPFFLPGVNGVKPSWTVILDDAFFAATVAAVAERVACNTEGNGADFFFVVNFVENPSYIRLGVDASLYATPWTFLRPVTFCSRLFL